MTIEYNDKLEILESPLGTPILLNTGESYVLGQKGRGEMLLYTVSFPNRERNMDAWDGPTSEIQYRIPLGTEWQAVTLDAVSDDDLKRILDDLNTPQAEGLGNIVHAVLSNPMLSPSHRETLDKVLLLL